MYDDVMQIIKHQINHNASHLNPQSVHTFWALGQNTFMICPPKLAHVVETVSLGSKSFQTGVTLGGAWWRAAFLLPMQSCWAENLHHGTGGRKILLARIPGWLNQVAKATSLISH